jgi:hypothetical protein
MTTISSLKERLDDAGTLVEAQSIVNYALAHSDAEKLATFLIDLFDEFVGPDPLGGELGTKQRIVRIFCKLMFYGYDLRRRFAEEGRDFSQFEQIIIHE